MEFDNKYFNAHYHNNKDLKKEENLLTNGTTRSKALQKTQKNMWKIIELSLGNFQELL